MHNIVELTEEHAEKLERTKRKWLPAKNRPPGTIKECELPGHHRLTHVAATNVVTTSSIQYSRHDSR